MRYSDPELVSRLAAEYVLGTLQGPARSRFDSLLEEREVFQEKVEDWERRLGFLLGGVTESPPPPAAWETIAARIAPIAPVQEGRGALDRLRWWQRVAATACVALIIVVAVALWPRPESTELDAGYVVLVRDDTQRTAWVIDSSPDLSELTVSAAAPMSVPPGKSCYLWVKPETSDEPLVLGLLPESGAAHIQVRDELRRLLPGHLLVSMEDGEAGSPATPSTRMKMRSDWSRSLPNEF